MHVMMWPRAYMSGGEYMGQYGAVWGSTGQYGVVRGPGGNMPLEHTPSTAIIQVTFVQTDLPFLSCFRAGTT